MGEACHTFRWYHLIAFKVYVRSTILLECRCVLDFVLYSELTTDQRKEIETLSVYCKTTLCFNSRCLVAGIFPLLMLTRKQSQDYADVRFHYTSHPSFTIAFHSKTSIYSN